MKEITVERIHTMCNDLYKEGCSPETLCVKLAEHIEEALKNGYKYTWDTQVCILVGVTSWLRSPEGLKAFTNVNATNIIINMHDWVEKMEDK